MVGNPPQTKKEPVAYTFEMPARARIEVLASRPSEAEEIKDALLTPGKYFEAIHSKTGIRFQVKLDVVPE